MYLFPQIKCYNNILWNLMDAVINYVFLKNLCRYEIFLPQAFFKWILISSVQKKLKEHEEFTQILRANEYEWKLTGVVHSDGGRNSSHILKAWYSILFGSELGT